MVNRGPFILNMFKYMANHCYVGCFVWLMVTNCLPDLLPVVDNECSVTISIF